MMMALRRLLAEPIGLPFATQQKQRPEAEADRLERMAEDARSRCHSNNKAARKSACSIHACLHHITHDDNAGVSLRWSCWAGSRCDDTAAPPHRS